MEPFESLSANTFTSLLIDTNSLSVNDLANLLNTNKEFKQFISIHKESFIKLALQCNICKHICSLASSFETDIVDVLQKSDIRLRAFEGFIEQIINHQTKIVHEIYLPHFIKVPQIDVNYANTMKCVFFTEMYIKKSLQNHPYKNVILHNLITQYTWYIQHIFALRNPGTIVSHHYFIVFASLISTNMKVSLLQLLGRAKLNILQFYRFFNIMLYNGYIVETKKIVCDVSNMFLKSYSETQATANHALLNTTRHFMKNNSEAKSKLLLLELNTMIFYLQNNKSTTKFKKNVKLIYRMMEFSIDTIVLPEHLELAQTRLHTMLNYAE